MYAKRGGGEMLTTILIFHVRLKGYVYGELQLTTISCVLVLQRIIPDYGWGSWWVLGERGE